MPYSMTGIGRATGTIRTPRVTFEVEVKSYNHRFLDISVRAPNGLAPFDDEIKQLVQERVSRGHVVVTIQQDREVMSESFSVDRTLLRAYLKVAQEFKTLRGVTGTIDVNTLLTIPGLVRMSQSKAMPRSLFRQFQPILRRALDDLVSMKEREGSKTTRGIERSLKLIESRLSSVGEMLPVRNQKQRERLVEVMKGFNDSVDKARFYQEVLYVAERGDVSEECHRLAGHLEQFRDALAKEPYPGRRLNFLLQEIQREANTLSVKAGYLPISEAVVIIKEEVEKIREQIQNIE